ncbi:hypothetical protein D3C78_1575200 [compost metagenome]
MQATVAVFADGGIKLGIAGKQAPALGDHERQVKLPAFAALLAHLNAVGERRVVRVGDQAITTANIENRQGRGEASIEQAELGTHFELLAFHRFGELTAFKDPVVQFGAH